MIVNISKRSTSGGRSSWYKKVTKCDNSKSNGYAFEGDFLNDGENTLDIGDIVIEKIPAGSVKNNYFIAAVYIVSKDVTDESFEFLREEISSPANLQLIKVFDWRKEFLSFRDQVCQLIKEKKGDLEDKFEKFTTEELLKEIKRREKK